MEYVVNKGVIQSNAGLPGVKHWFCDGRTAVEMDNDSISQVDFFSPATKGSYIAMRQRFWGGIQLFLNDRKVRPARCEIYPFGFTSQGEDCDWGLWIGGDRVHISLTPKTENASLRLEFYDEILFTPDNSDHPDIRLGGMPRTWQMPRLEDGMVKLSYEEAGDVNYVTFSSNRALSLTTRPKHGKYMISGENLPANEKTEFVLSFSTSGHTAYQDDGELYQSQMARYARVAEKAPVLKSKKPLLNQFFALAPMYHESLKTVDVPGAIRAQSTHYWVWGWDSMTSNECSFYWGDMAFIGQMLACMEKYAIPGEGVAHAYSRDMASGAMGAAPAQGMYITLLDHYRIAGGDAGKYYNFAKQVFVFILETEVENRGLCKGTSLYPDYRNLINETGNDLSSFNNTVSYCAARSMQDIAESMGDAETAAAAKAFADRVEANFEKVLYNEKYGFFDSSAEATTLQQRNVLSNNAIKWENNHCRDLVWGHREECLDFYRKNLVTPSGIAPLPKWCDCYDADANQLHCWWPVMSEFYTRLANHQNRPELMEQYADWICYWSERLMCPEGISCYEWDKNVPYDQWNAQPGIWHGYSIRGFYNAIVHSYIGVDFDRNGVNFYPYSGEEVEIENLHFGKRSFHIQMTGKGTKIQNVTLNGRSLGPVKNIPFADLAEKNTIQVVRTE